MTRPLVEFKVSVPDTPENRNNLTSIPDFDTGWIREYIEHEIGYEGVTVTEIAPEPGEEKRDK